MDLRNNLLFNKNEAKDMVLHKSATAPSSPVEGQTYFNTTDHIVYTWNGTIWSSGGGGIISSDSSVTDIQTLTKAEYDALTPVQKANKMWMTTDELEGGSPFATKDIVAYDYTNAALNYGYSDGIQFATTPNGEVTRTGLINLLSLYSGKRLRFYISYGGNTEVQIFERYNSAGGSRFFFTFIRDYNQGDLFFITMRLDGTNSTSWVCRYDNNKIIFNNLTIGSESNARILKILKIEVMD